MNTVTHPESPLATVVGPVDGNAFAIIGAVCKALKRAGFSTEEEQFQSSAFACGSYDELLRLAMLYVEFEGL